MFKLIYKEKIFRYFIVGGLSWIIDILIFYYLYSLHNLNIYFASSLSFIFAVTFNFFFGNIFVFENQFNYGKAKSFLLVFFTSFTGLGINIFFVYLISESFFLWPPISKAIAAIPTFLWNYALRKKIFRANY
jgi:putative flippase GtrA